MHKDERDQGKEQTRQQQRHQNQQQQRNDTPEQLKETDEWEADKALASGTTVGASMQGGDN